MNEYAEITGYRETEQGTELLVIIPDRHYVSKIRRFATEGKVQALIQIDDSRRISIEQLRKSHALMNEIANYLGELPDYFKALMKSWYVEVYGDLKDGFSMADMSIDQARRFINLVIEFAFEMDIPLRFEEIPSIVEVDGFLYLCLKKKKCAVCGKDAEIHHWDAIGMGRDRREVDDSDHRKIALCREHHSEGHTIGRDTFQAKYYVYGIIYLDD
ncbi:putative HNHc nuclease [Anaerosolibacter sp.]|uniref:putative HNHc nuclease n=1 Tax=Anaerosolibacter sp. TaxID=1872527 RepID=UPI0039F086CB